MATHAVQIGEKRLKGVSVCRGVAIGKPFFFSYHYGSAVNTSIGAEDVDAEVLRYRRALERCKRDLESLQLKMVSEHIAEGVAILEAHQELLADPLMSADIEQLIKEQYLNAETAFQRALNSYQQHFASLSDPFFRERFKDIEDIARRIMGHLRHTIRFSLSDVPCGSVVFANELTAYEAAEADPHRVSAFVTQAGGMTTHAAIVAKAKGIPYVTRVSFKSEDLNLDETVIVDARTGDIILAPSTDTLTSYSHVQHQISLHAHILERSTKARAETYDGLAVRLSANIENVEEVALLHQYGGAGVGLLRSENVFFTRDTLPSEDEQYSHYRAFVEQMQGLPLVIRTFDLGGDKSAMGKHEESTEPFFVGCRALRFLLQERTIFKRQLRAILRAAVGGQVSVLFPMVTSVTELREAKAFLAEAASELSQEGIAVPKKIRLGCMIEVPSAAMIADLLAAECDFLSIGTNDLVHYSQAVDRAYQATSTLQTLCHPSLLRLIKLIVQEGNIHGIPVAICGEIASDPRFTPLLLGLGVHELSVACRYIPLIKHAIRRTSAVAAIELAHTALRLATSVEVQEFLTEAYRKAVPDDCFYNY